MLFIHSLCLLVGGMISQNAREAQPQTAKVEVVESVKSHVERPKQPQSGGHGHGRPSSFALADIKMSHSTKNWVNIFALFTIYGSYLYLRVRKSRVAKARRQNQS